MKKFLMIVGVAAMLIGGCRKKDDVRPDSESTLFEVTTDLFGKVAVKITDRGRGIGTRTLHKDTVYILDNKVFVAEGQTLTIQAGTVIRGETGTGENATALVVMRGGKILAEGTAQNPIIMTTISDDLNDPNDIPPGNNGLWGGLIILGKARINDPTGENSIEGIPTTEGRGLYGGNNDNDDSGVLRYVSVRHGGAEIGAGNEINGITFGGVGRSTVAEYLEVFSNFDDGFEWFGGCVNMKYIVASYCEDDSFDWDQGYTGRIQFLVGVKRPGVGNRMFECNGVVNGATFPYNVEPVSIPIVANGIFIGHGRNSGESQAVELRQNSGGKFYNCIFHNFSQGIRIDNVKSTEPIESETRLDEGDIVFANNLFSNTGSGGTLEGVAANSPGTTRTKLETHLASNNNVYSNQPGVAGLTVGREPAGLDFALVPGQTADNLTPFDVTTFNNDPASQNFFLPVTKIGVGGSAWLKGWTALDEYGFLID